MTCWPLLLPQPAVLTSPSRSRRSSSSIVVKSPSCRSSPSITAHCRCALGPSPPRSRHPLPLRSCPAPSLAVEEPSRRPSPSSSRLAVPRGRGAVAPSIAVEEPSRHPSPSRSRRPCQLTAPATRRAPPSLSSGWLSCCLSAPLIAAIAFCASRPSS